MEVDRQGRDLGQKSLCRLPLHLPDHFEEQLNENYFDLLTSTLLQHGLFVACRVHTF